MVTWFGTGRAANTTPPGVDRGLLGANPGVSLPGP